MTGTLQLNNMKYEISEKNIVIIGGHVNWTNKLKNEFPNWRFIDAKISRTSDYKLVEHADIVYFFSKYISHGTYNKFVKFVRERCIPFGYIHTVNIESMVQQLYQDLILN